MESFPWSVCEFILPFSHVFVKTILLNGGEKGREGIHKELAFYGQSHGGLSSQTLKWLQRLLCSTLVLPPCIDDRKMVLTSISPVHPVYVKSKKQGEARQLYLYFTTTCIHEADSKCSCVYAEPFFVSVISGLLSVQACLVVISLWPWCVDGTGVWHGLGIIDTDASWMPQFSSFLNSFGKS